MRYRENAKNGDKLSILGFGCMRYPRKGATIDVEETEKLIISAIESGVNYFDTAYIYMRGKSESILGEILAKGYRDKVKIATKLPPFLVKKNTDLDKIFFTELDRLKTDRIDYYLIHMLSDVQMWDRLKGLGILEWIDEKKKAGQIINIGFSYHGGPQEFVKIMDCFDWDFCQIQYNYLDEYNQAGKSGLLYAAAKGVPVMVMEPLRGGKIVDGLPKEVDRIWEKATPRRSVAEWALRWVWNHPEVTLLLSGMNEKSQLEENVRIASEVSENNFSEKERDLFIEARRILSEKMKVNCTACGYCMPCPSGVNIPTCFDAYNQKALESPLLAMSKYMMNTGALSKNPSYASLCVHCRKCESHCPQAIPISDTMREVVTNMEGPVFKIVVAIGKRVMK
ncbi:MAG: aldo/keto reductase [Clostridia bacterium]|nr:aldo/keto reductase [Clostridia bacterium]